MLAVVFNYTKIALALIKAGVNVNVKGKDGVTALRFALQERYTEIASMLIKAGAKNRSWNERSYLF